jgi:hypothetical protein
MLNPRENFVNDRGVRAVLRQPSCSDILFAPGLGVFTLSMKRAPQRFEAVTVCKLPLTTVAQLLSVTMDHGIMFFILLYLRCFRTTHNPLIGGSNPSWPTTLVWERR